MSEAAINEVISLTETCQRLHARIDQLTSANADLRAHVAEVERRATRMRELLLGILNDMPDKTSGIKYREVQFRDSEVQEIHDVLFPKAPK